MLCASGTESQEEHEPDPAAREVQPELAPGELPLNLVLARKLDGLPKDMGITLIGLGAAGVVIPGIIPPGISFILLGGALVWPRSLAGISGWVAKRCPWMVQVLIDFVQPLSIRSGESLPGLGSRLTSQRARVL